MKKIRSLKKFLSPQNCKNGQKWQFFGPSGPKFAKIKKRLGHSLTFTPERLYTKFQKIWLIRLGENALQTDGRTDGTEIIGPSGKIPGTNSLNLKTEQTSTCYSGPRNDVCSFLGYTAKQG